MTPHTGPRARIASALVRVAARLVPASRRAEWLREWRGELWARTTTGGPLIRPALGSFHHALWLRTDGWRTALASSGRSISLIDVKLGIRMLVKHPGLAAVSCLAISVAIAIGAVLEGVTSGLRGPLPFAGGERVVALEMVDARWNATERRILNDFLVWREHLESVQELGAFRMLEENLLTTGAEGGPVEVVAITANAFDLAGTSPLMGRRLLAADEAPSAPPVVVLSHRIWKRRFAADPRVLGQTVQIGRTPRTIVGVMPEAFAFPMNQDLWVPLKLSEAEHGPRTGPEVHLFGRLAPGATLESARAELQIMAERAVAAWPGTHEHLRPRILPFTLQFLEGTAGWLFPAVRLFSALLLTVICATVATLVYARTATRHGEIAVRSALGASRPRIIGQLFIEALVLTTLAAALGLVLAGWGMTHFERLAEQFMRSAYWLDFGLSARTLIHVGALTAMAAVLVGVLPALRATGSGLESRIRQSGGSGLRLGRTWMALIGVQVAVAVAGLPAAASLGWTFFTYSGHQPGYASSEFLVARMHMDSDFGPGEAEAFSAADRGRFARLQAELVGRLASEPGVTAVVPLEGIPGLNEGVVVELDASSAERQANTPLTRVVGTAAVDAGMFEALEIPLLAGRGLGRADADSASTAVLVNRSFLEQVLDGESPLGRRLRPAPRVADAEPGPWYEIVGVVEDFPPRPLEPGLTQPAFYRALRQGELWHLLAVRTRDGTPMSFAARMRDVAAGVDSGILVRSVERLDDAMREEHEGMRFLAIALALTALSVLLLSAAGIFALMWFTVAQRHREIGIRRALGAGPRRLLLGIFARAATPLAGGLAAGAAVAVLIAAGLGPEEGGAPWSVPAVTAIIALVALAATVLPARRGLAVQPTEALRAE